MAGNDVSGTGGGIKPTVKILFADRNACIYTKCYCEENVWKLCEHVKNHHPETLTKCYAVFISNKDKQIPLWMQKSSKRDDRLVIWDYHVIFLHEEEDGGSTWVYDIDSELDFPCEFVEYAMKGLRDDRKMRSDFKRNFRVIQADEFLKTFASDRSHMMSEEGEWLMPPPLYPCIHSQESDESGLVIPDFSQAFASVIEYFPLPPTKIPDLHNLSWDPVQALSSFNNIQYFISMDPSEGFGDVMDSVEFIKTFTSSQANQD